MYKPQIATRSLFFDIKNGELIEVPVIEFVSQHKNYIKSLIKERIDPEDEYFDYDVNLIRNGIHENTTLSNINLDQAIHIALHLGIEKELILSNPNHFTMLGNDKNTYMFSNTIFENYTESILHKLAIIVVDIFELQPKDVIHVFIPEWMNCKIAGFILEICSDPIFGPNLSMIDFEHPRREEIEGHYL
jgi:hypothetical protein